MKIDRHIVLLMFLISSMNLAFCADENRPGTTTVDIKDFSFQPDSVTVGVGTTVTWVNHDSVDHTITSDTGKFDSGNIKSGVYGYHCAIHPTMTGVVTVTSNQNDNGRSTATNSNASQQTASNASGTSSPVAKQPRFEGIVAAASILSAGYLLIAKRQ